MKPNRKVIAATRRVIQYLITMRDLKIRWTSEEDKVPVDKRNKLWGAADASYASDVITRRSHGGYILFLNGGCISSTEPPWQRSPTAQGRHFAVSSCSASLKPTAQAHCWRELAPRESVNSFAGQRTTLGSATAVGAAPGAASGGQ
jgi:hypothetical protein